MLSWAIGGAAVLCLLVLFRRSCLRDSAPTISCCRRAKAAPRCVLITGAAGGFGRAIAKKYAAVGCQHLALVDIAPQEKLEELKSELLPSLVAPGATISVHRCDVGDAAAVAATVNDVCAATGGQGPDVLVSNAGIVNGADVEDLTPAQLERTFRVNVLASFHLCRSILPLMKARGSGTLVFVASVMGLIGSARLSDYCASKWALLGLVESLRLELQRDGYGGRIDTVAILPYAAATGMFPGIFEDARDRNWLRSAMFPMLTADSVAASLVRAAQTRGDAVVTLPPLVHWMAAAVHALPVAWGDAVTGFFGGHHGMSSFRAQLPQAQAHLPQAQAHGAAPSAPAAPANTPLRAAPAHPTGQATSRLPESAPTSPAASVASSFAGGAAPAAVVTSRKARAGSLAASEFSVASAGGAGAVPSAAHCGAHAAGFGSSGPSASAAHCAACAAVAAASTAAAGSAVGPSSVRKRSSSTSSRRWQR